MLPLLWPVCAGLLMTAYEENPKLKSFFKVLSLSLDNKGLPYISMMEAYKVGTSVGPQEQGQGQVWGSCHETLQGAKY